MLKMVAGLIAGGVVTGLTMRPLLAGAAFLVAGAFLQWRYARTLNGHLGGVDPVREFGARSLKELRAIVPVPLRISALDFSAKACGWALLYCLFIQVRAMWRE